MSDSRAPFGVNGTLLNSALTRRGISAVLLIVVFSILVAAFALKSMRQTSREHVAGMLTQMVDSTNRMVQLWETQQRMEVESWAKAPEVVALTADLLAAASGSGRSENESRLDQSLKSEAERKQYNALKPAAGAELRRLLLSDGLQHGFDVVYLFDSIERRLTATLD